MTNDIQQTSRYLDDSPAIPLHPPVANTFGMTQAIILQQIRYWMDTYKKAEQKLPDGERRHYHHGRWWVFNSYKNWQEENFHFMSESTIGRNIRELERLGVLLTGQFNKRKGDKTKWYTIDLERMDWLIGLHEGDYTIRVYPRGTTPSRHFGIMVTSKWNHGRAKMVRALPETTTETTKDSHSSAADAPPPPPATPDDQQDAVKESPPTHNEWANAVMEGEYGVRYDPDGKNERIKKSWWGPVHSRAKWWRGEKDAEIAPPPDATPERVRAFYQWFRETHPDIDVPTSQEKVTEWWVKWQVAQSKPLTRQQRKPKNQLASGASPERTLEILEAAAKAKATA